VLSLATAAAAAAGGYLLGGIPFGAIVSRLAGGPDPRRVGSGRIGGANVARSLGFRWAALSGLLDVAKAVVAVLLARGLGWGPEAEAVAATAAVLGHGRSPYIGFQGGRGVAPAFGALVVLAPQAAALALAVFVCMTAMTRMSSVGSLAASAVGGAVAVVLALAGWLTPAAGAYGAAACLVVWAFHHDNIGRLLAGTERRFGSR
jgi:acyl phosphate:glycerol-3-phosphate acyltransferase